MIVFCDTSALMKLYAQEEHSERMRNAVKSKNVVLANAVLFIH